MRSIVRWVILLTMFTVPLCCSSLTGMRSIVRKVGLFCDKEIKKGCSSLTGMRSIVSKKSQVDSKPADQLQFPDGNEVYCKMETNSLYVCWCWLQFPDGNEVYCKSSMTPPDRGGVFSCSSLTGMRSIVRATFLNHWFHAIFWAVFSKGGFFAMQFLAFCPPFEKSNDFKHLAKYKIQWFQQLRFLPFFATPFALYYLLEITQYFIFQRGMQKLSYPQYLLPFLGFFEGLLLNLYNSFFLLYLSYSVFKEQNRNFEWTGR